MVRLNPKLRATEYRNFQKNPRISFDTLSGSLRVEGIVPEPIYFTESNGDYIARSFVSERLSENPAAGTFCLTNGAGRTYTFFNLSPAHSQPGALKNVMEPDGRIVSLN